MRYSKNAYQTIEDGITSSGPQAGQFAIAGALLEVADAIGRLGGAMDGAADTLGKGPLADGLRSVADAFANLDPANHIASDNDDDHEEGRFKIKP